MNFFWFGFFTFAIRLYLLFPIFITANSEIWDQTKESFEITCDAMGDYFDENPYEEVSGLSND